MLQPSCEDVHTLRVVHSRASTRARPLASARLRPPRQRAPLRSHPAALYVALSGRAAVVASKRTNHASASLAAVATSIAGCVEHGINCLRFIPRGGAQQPVASAVSTCEHACEWSYKTVNSKKRISLANNFFHVSNPRPSPSFCSIVDPKQLTHDTHLEPTVRATEQQQLARGAFGHHVHMRLRCVSREMPSSRLRCASQRRLQWNCASPR